MKGYRTLLEAQAHALKTVAALRTAAAATDAAELPGPTREAMGAFAKQLDRAARRACEAWDTTHKEAEEVKGEERADGNNASSSRGGVDVGGGRGGGLGIGGGGGGGGGGVGLSAHEPLMALSHLTKSLLVEQRDHLLYLAMHQDAPTASQDSIIGFYAIGFLCLTLASDFSRIGGTLRDISAKE